MSEERIPLAGVIGCPISHSRSPILHGHWLKRYGIKGHYIPMHVEPDNLERVLRTMPEMGFVGCNITIPHKVSALEIADMVSDRASLIGAANTLIFRADGKIQADNTDGYGFMANLRQKAPDWDPTTGPALVLGAGGASRAILTAMLDAGTPEILLTNRTRTNSDALRDEFGARIRVVEWVHAGAAMGECDTVINTTSLGMKGANEFKVPTNQLRSGTLVTDIVYNPLRTKLLNEAEQMGCVTVDGLGMLLHQAVPGFERWFGKRPEVDDDLRAAVMG